MVDKKRIAQVRKWQNDNKEKVNGYLKKWYEKNGATYRKNNRIRLRKHCSNTRNKYREKYNERQLERQRKLHREIPYYALVQAAKHRAKIKNIPCDIDIEWAKIKWLGKCELTGIVFNREPLARCGHVWNSPSIDRIKPELGYTKNNCRFILMCLNSFKGSTTDENILIVSKLLLQNYPI